MGEFWVLTGGKGKRTNATAPCATDHFSRYNRTDTIGAGPLKILLDKYLPDSRGEKVVPTHNAGHAHGARRAP